MQESEANVLLMERAAFAAKELPTPLCFSYGNSPVEKLYVYPAGGPIFIFIHGGSWKAGRALMYTYPAICFNRAGVTYITVDFSTNIVQSVKQVRRAINWVYKNAKHFGGDAARIYIGGHSSGANLCAAALIADKRRIVKGAALVSGIYDIESIAGKSNYNMFTARAKALCSSIRHIERVRAKVAVLYGKDEQVLFIEQAELLAQRLHTEARPVANHDHFDTMFQFDEIYKTGTKTILKMMGVLK